MSELEADEGGEGEAREAARGTIVKLLIAEIGQLGERDDAVQELGREHLAGKRDLKLDILLDREVADERPRRARSAEADAAAQLDPPGGSDQAPAAMTRSSVLLPAPLRPMMPRICPGGTSKLTSLSEKNGFRG